MLIQIAKLWLILIDHASLVGGFNPFEQYQSKWESSLSRGENKNIWNHHPVLLWRDVWRGVSHKARFAVPQVLSLEHLLTAHHWHICNLCQASWYQFPASAKLYYANSKWRKFKAYITNTLYISLKFPIYDICIKSASSCRNNNKIFNSLESSESQLLSSTINSFPEALNRIFCPVRSAMHFNIWVRHPTKKPVLSWCCHRPRGT